MGDSRIQSLWSKCFSLFCFSSRGMFKYCFCLIKAFCALDVFSCLVPLSDWVDSCCHVSQCRLFCSFSLKPIIRRLAVFFYFLFLLKHLNFEGTLLGSVAGGAVFRGNSEGSDLDLDRRDWGKKRSEGSIFCSSQFSWVNLSTSGQMTAQNSCVWWESLTILKKEENTQRRLRKGSAIFVRNVLIYWF